MATKGRIDSIEAISMVDQATVRVRDSILAGDLSAGQPFSITDLAVQLGVSHIPVREALRRLESEGLVILRPGRGAMVRPLQEIDVRGIYRLRGLMEPTLAAWSCQLLTEDDFGRLEEYLGVFQGPNWTIDTEVVMHKEFHFTLLRPAASEWDIRVLEYLWNANERYARLLFDPTSDAIQRHLEKSHRSLVVAARSKKPDQLERAVAQHLAENEQAILTELSLSPAEEVAN